MDNPEPTLATPSAAKRARRLRGLRIGTGLAAAAVAASMLAAAVDNLREAADRVH